MMKNAINGGTLNGVAAIGIGLFVGFALLASSVFQGKCCVTACGLGELLRASHIKPWRDSNNSERLDPENGLALTANLDALFDTHMITFEDSGRIVLSRKIVGLTIDGLGPTGNLIAKPGTRKQAYLASHREEFRRKDSIADSPVRSSINLFDLPSGRY